MTAIIRPITALLLSAALMLAANGLEGVLLPLRGAIEGFSPLEIGLLGACYFGGLTFGCIMSPRVILRVGHIRAFLLFAAMATASPLLEAMAPAPVLWWACRFSTGICFAGIMNVVESWLSSVTTNANRGRVMSVYAMINFGSLTVGQQLTNLSVAGDFRLFSLVAMLCAFAAVPLALTLSAVPTPPLRPQFRLRRMYRVSPAAVAGVLGAGLANGAFWSLAPVYGRDSGLPEALVPVFVSLAVLGGAVAQWPVGRMSDRFDRRFVLLALCGAAAATGFLLSRFGGADPWPTLLLGILFGVCALPVYWVSFAHANDLAEPEEAVNVSASLLLLFSTGAIFGPVLASLLKQHYGTGSLFLYTASIHLTVMTFVLLRLLLRSAPPPEAERVAYEDLPISTTPAPFEAALADAHAEARNLELRDRGGGGNVGETTKP
jgi:MFS family permease